MKKQNENQPGGKGLSTEKKAQVIALKAKNLSNRQIAARAGVSVGSVSNILRGSAREMKAEAANRKRRAARMEEYWKNWREKQQKEPAETSGDETATVAKRYTSLDPATISEIKRLKDIYLSQRSVIQIGVEILVRLRTKISLPEKSGQGHAGMSYKLPPRTIQQVSKLSEIYGSPGQVLQACTMVLDENIGLEISPPA